MLRQTGVCYIIDTIPALELKFPGLLSGVAGGDHFYRLFI
jgi:hypothetical protein